MTQQVSLLSLTAKARVQSQHNLCRIRGNILSLEHTRIFLKSFYFLLPVSVQRDPYLRYLL